METTERIYNVTFWPEVTNSQRCEKEISKIRTQLSLIIQRYRVWKNFHILNHILFKNLENLSREAWTISDLKKKIHILNHILLLNLENFCMWDLKNFWCEWKKKSQAELYLFFNDLLSKRWLNGCMMFACCEKLFWLKKFSHPISHPFLGS